MPDFRLEFWPPADPQGPIAFLTMARDEMQMLRAWVANGLRISADAQFYVVDHASEPALGDELRSLAPGRIHVLGLPAVPFDDDFKAMTLSSIAKILTQCFEVVVTTDCDELLVGLGMSPSEVLPKLRELGPFTAPVGFEVVQHTGRESGFDFAHPLEDQRAYGFLTSGYTKPVIWHQGRTEFGAGLHTIRDDFEYETSLGLMHLRSVDAELSDARAAQRRGVTFSGSQIETGRGKNWLREPSSRANFFAPLAKLDQVPAFGDTFPEFMQSVTQSHAKRPSGFYGHNISLTSGHCEIGPLLYRGAETAHEEPAARR